MGRYPKRYASDQIDTLGKDRDWDEYLPGQCLHLAEEHLPQIELFVRFTLSSSGHCHTGHSDDLAAPLVRQPLCDQMSPVGPGRHARR